MKKTSNKSAKYPSVSSAQEQEVIRLNAILEMNKELEKLVAKRTEELAKTVSQLLEINGRLAQENRERKSAERALRKQEEELRLALANEKNLNKLKSRFVSMASHEFRTPLSSVLAAAELIQAYPRTDQQEKREKNVTRIRNAITSLTSILNDFLSYSKLEEGHLQQHPQWFELGEFCDEFLDDLKGVLKEGQHINCQVVNGKGIVFLDKNILKNILFNLVSNASKYSHINQPIKCSAELSNGILSLIIQDFGIGIPLEDQPDLFERFFRAHNVENIQGTGLGLNITKKYVEILGGEISFVSELGKGATFFVNLPVQMKEAKS